MLLLKVSHLILTGYFNVGNAPGYAPHYGLAQINITIELQEFNEQQTFFSPQWLHNCSFVRTSSDFLKLGRF